MDFACEYINIVLIYLWGLYLAVFSVTLLIRDSFARFYIDIIKYY